MKTPHKLLLVAAAGLTSVGVLLGATSSTTVTVKSVWIYPYETQQAGLFSNATVMEKTATGIKFRADGKVYEHCGHYTLEN